MRRRADEDLFFFLRDVLGLTLLEEEPHGKLCRWLQRKSKTGRRLILMPRNSFKTSIVGGWKLWKLVKNPNDRFLYHSDVRANAKKLLMVQRLHLEGNQRLRQLYGDLTMPQGWTDEQITVDRTMIRKEPSIMTSGMDQVVVMLHFDDIYVDDLVNNTNIGSAEALDKTYENLQLLNPLLEIPAINPDREITVVGTRWDYHDAYSRILRAAGWEEEEIREALDAGEAQIGEWDVFFRSAYRRIDESGKTEGYLNEDGEPLFSLFTKDFLASQRSSHNLGAYWFAANYLNDPVPKGDATFKKEWFRYWTPPLPDELDVLMAVDPAISKKRGSDYTGIIVGAADKYANLDLLLTWKDKVSPLELCHRIYQVYLDWRPRIIGLETIGFQQVLRVLLQDLAREYPGVALPIREIKHGSTESKDMRILGLQGLYEDGRILHTRAMGNLELELVLWRAGRRRQRDDLADTLTMIRSLMLPARAPGGNKGTPAPPENPVTGY